MRIWCTLKDVEAGDLKNSDGVSQTIDACSGLVSGAISSPSLDVLDVAAVGDVTGPSFAQSAMGTMHSRRDHLLARAGGPEYMEGKNAVPPAGLLYH